MLRIKAEKQLGQSSDILVKPVNEADIKKLLHELQVHQIELEMQNEELRKANETAETALRKYTMLYDFAPTGYFTIDSEGIIKDLNFTGAEILGEKRFTLENTNIKFFISEGFISIFEKFMSKVFSTIKKESCIINLSRNNNTLHTVYIEGIVISEDHKCLLSVVDITAFKK
jgi:PAS domain-containing protein